MKLNKIVYGFAVILLSLLFVGCGKSEKGLVGTWVDKSDKVAFNEDGSFSSYYYFYPGEWQEFGEGQVRIIQSMLGAETYFYEISDDGVLILTNCYELDGEWKKGKLTYEFVREGKDMSLLDNISSTGEIAETEDNSKDTSNNITEESVDSASLDASVEDEVPTFSYDIEMENPIEAFGLDPAANEDTKHYYSWYGCYFTGTKFSFYYPQDFFNKVEKLDSLYKEVISTNTLAYKFTGSNGSELVTAVIEYENSDSFNNYLDTIESSVLEYENNLSIGSDPTGKIVRFWGYDSEAKDNIVYYIIRVEEDKAFVLETTVPNYTDQNDITRRDYYLECMYRGCGFSDSSDDIRGCEAYNEENPVDSEFRMMHAADVVNNAVGEDSLGGPHILTNVTDFEKDFHWRDLINLRNCISEIETAEAESVSDSTNTLELESGAVSTKYSENDAVKVMKLIIKTAENVDVDDEKITFDYSIENGIMEFTVFSGNKDGDHPMAVCSGDVDLNSGRITYFSNIYGFDKEFVLSDYLN